MAEMLCLDVHPGERIRFALGREPANGSGDHALMAGRFLPGVTVVVGNAACFPHRPARGANHFATRLRLV